MDDDTVKDADQNADDALKKARAEIAGERVDADEPPVAGSAQTSDEEEAQPPTDS